MTAYPFIVFVHVLGAVGIFATIAIETVSLGRLQLEIEVSQGSRMTLLDDELVVPEMDEAEVRRLAATLATPPPALPFASTADAPAPDEVPAQCSRS